MATSVVVYPDYDLTLYSVAPNTNYEGDTSFAIYSRPGASQFMHSLLKCDLSSIVPSGSLILSAFLSLYCTVSRGLGFIPIVEMEIQIMRLVESWDALTATWYAREDSGGNPLAWTVEGGDFVEWGGMVTQPSFTIQSVGWTHSTSLVVPVQDAIDNRGGILDLGLRHPTETGDWHYACFRSVEYPSLKPYITIEYADAGAGHPVIGSDIIKTRHTPGRIIRC